MSFKDWLKDVAIRTIKTMAESALGAGIATAQTIGDVNWSIVLGTVLVSAVATILINIKNMPFGGEEVEE